MSNRSIFSSKAGRILQVVLNLLLAVPAVGLGAITLISPDVPAEALAENAIVGLAMLATAAILVFDMFRPFSGGVLLIIWSLIFAAIFNGFHLSEYVFESRQTGYQTFWSGVTLMLVILGLLSLVRARFGRDETKPDLSSHDS